MYSASNQSAICIKWPRNLHQIARQSDANHTVYQHHVMLLLLLFFITNWLTTLYKPIQNSRISDRNAFIFQHAPSCESICKRKWQEPTPDPSPREGRANLRNLSLPLPRRGELTCGASPGPSQGGESELARKLVITHSVIIHHALCIMN